MRYFVALDIPNDVRDQLEAVQRELAVANADARWIARDTMHLTLRFLGELDGPTLARVVETLGPELARLPPLRLTFDHVGAFPDADLPQVVWVGCATDTALTALAAAVDRVATDAGAPPDKLPFTPHVTIARVSSPSAALPAAIAGARIAASFEAVDVVVYRSTLTASAPVYAAHAILPFAPR